MSSPSNNSAPPVSVANSVKEARERANLSVRQLAKGANISHAQISRLESGEVKKPTRDVLVSVSRGLNRNPLPLLILAGYCNVPESSSALIPLFRKEAELPKEWGDWATWPVSEVNRLIRDPKTPLQTFKQIAADVFRVEETVESMWDPTYLLAIEKGGYAGQLSEFMGIWRYLDEPLRDRWLEYGRSLRNIADDQYRVEMDEIDSRVDAQIRAVKERAGVVLDRISKESPEMAAELEEDFSLLWEVDSDD